MTTDLCFCAEPARANSTTGCVLPQFREICICIDGAEQNQRQRGEGKPGTFNFLGLLITAVSTGRAIPPSGGERLGNACGRSWKSPLPEISQGGQARRARGHAVEAAPSQSPCDRARA